MNKVGIDGCRAGWLAVSIEASVCKYAVLSEITELNQWTGSSQSALIDMPIGLADANISRNIDTKIRIELTKRTSTVFSPPCRNAVYAKNYHDAQVINKRELGKGISKQAWNICPKIKALDQYLTENSKVLLIESHPELCFKQLNNGQVVQSKKRNKEGIAERLQILSQHEPHVLDWFYEIKTNTLRKHVKKDDIVDALCLAISQYYPLIYLQGEQGKDA